MDAMSQLGFPDAISITPLLNGNEILALLNIRGSPIVRMCCCMDSLTFEHQDNGTGRELTRTSVVVERYRTIERGTIGRAIP
jgi:hypothetical protein